MNTANSGMVIRDETDADIDAITEITIAAFETLEISNHTEQKEWCDTSHPTVWSRVV